MAGSGQRVERVTVPGAELWTETSGSGCPIVLAHGGPGLSDNLGPVAAMLDDRATVHRFDQRACGRSTGAGPGQTVASAVSDLDALRRHWGHESWIVGGHSWGAALALFYAFAHPERTQAVIYLSGPGLARAENPAARPRLERLTPTEQQEFADARRRASEGDEAAAREVAHLLWLTDFSDRSKAPDFAVEPLFRFPHNPEAAAALGASADACCADGSVRDTARSLSLPVLIVHGRDDPLPVEGAIDLAGLLPYAELAILDGVGHTLWLEDPLAVAAALRGFVSRR